MHIAFSSSSVHSLSHVRLFATSWTAAPQASLSITSSQSLPKRMSIESVMPSNHLILCHPLLLPPSIFPGIRVFSKTFSIGEGERYGPALLRAFQSRERLHLGKPHCSGKSTCQTTKMVAGGVSQKRKSAVPAFNFTVSLKLFFSPFSSEVTQEI